MHTGLLPLLPWNKKDDLLPTALSPRLVLALGQAAGEWLAFPSIPRFPPRLACAHARLRKCLPSLARQVDGGGGGGMTLVFTLLCSARRGSGRMKSAGLAGVEPGG